MTAIHLRNLEKIPIVIDEVTDGIHCFTVEINASLSKEDEVRLNNQKKEKMSIGMKISNLFGFADEGVRNEI
jgi:hypothetical protein